MVNNPNIRFAGFGDDWVQRKFKDILKTHSFRSYLADGSDDGKYEVIQQGNNPIVGYSDGEPFTDYKDITLFGDHTVSLYNPQSPFFIATDGVKILSADNFEGDYLYITLERYKPAPQGYKRHFIILKNKDLCFTRNVEEQQKIGSTFATLDHKIGLEERQIALLKDLKKGYLQKMFPKNGAKVPELRFAGFANDWEDRKLGELSDKVTEKNKNSEFVETLTNSAEFGIINQRDFFNKDISNEKNLNGYYIVREDDFVYNPRISNYAPVGPIKRNKLGRTGVMSPLYYVFRPHNIDKKFLEYYFDTTVWHRFMELNGDSGARADRFAIKDSVFVDMPIPYPTMDEQQQIGNFFKQLDDTIAANQHKLELLKDLKKGLLQQMFV